MTGLGHTVRHDIRGRQLGGLGDVTCTVNANGQRVCSSTGAGDAPTTIAPSGCPPCPLRSPIKCPPAPLCPPAQVITRYLAVGGGTAVARRAMLQGLPNNGFSQSLYRPRGVGGLRGLGDATCTIVNGARVCSTDPGTSSSTTPAPAMRQLCADMAAAPRYTAAVFRGSISGSDSGSTWSFVGWDGDTDVYQRTNGSAAYAAVTAGSKTSSPGNYPRQVQRTVQMCHWEDGSGNRLTPDTQGPSPQPAALSPFAPSSVALPSGAVVGPIVTTAVPDPTALTTADQVALSNEGGASSIIATPGQALTAATSSGTGLLANVPTWALVGGGGLALLFVTQMMGRR